MEGGQEGGAKGKGNQDRQNQRGIQRSGQAGGS